VPRTARAGWWMVTVTSVLILFGGFVRRSSPIRSRSDFDRSSSTIRGRALSRSRSEDRSYRVVSDRIARHASKSCRSCSNFGQSRAACGSSASRSPTNLVEMP
jgi:hypothetical protein